MTTQITTPISYPNTLVKDGDNLMNASANWRNRPADQRFKTLDELDAFCNKQRLTSRVHDIKVTDIKVSKTEDDDLAVNGALVKANPTHWSLGQLAGLVKAPAGYLRTLPTQIAADALNFGLRARAAADGNDVKAMVRDTNDDGTHTDLVALTGVNYGRIWNGDITTAVKNLLPQLPVKFYNPHAYAGGKFGAATTEPSGLFASDRDLFMFFVSGGDISSRGGHSIDDGKSELNRGWFAWNSEVGDKTFGLATFMFRVTCANLIVWGASDIKELKIRHSLGAPAKFDEDAMPTLLQFANANMDREAAAIKAAQKELLPKEADDQIAFFKKLGFTGGEYKNAKEAAEREEGQFESLWDAVNGLTAYARTFAHIDARVDLQKRAGKFLDLVA
jgi:hypothetical protein